MIYNVLIATLQTDKSEYINSTLRQLKDITISTSFTDNDGELEKKAALLRTDLVILDTALHVPDTNALIETLVRFRPNIQVIILGISNAVENIVSPLAQHVCGFLAEPFTDEQLLYLVKKATVFIEEKRTATLQRRYHRMSGQLFLDQARIGNPENHLPVSLVNELFGFRFKDDAYRMVVINIDDRGEKASVLSSGKFDKILVPGSDRLYRHITSLCYESVFRISVNRIKMLINYPLSKDAALVAKLKEWIELESENMPNGFSLSLCYSGIHSDIRDILKMSNEAEDAVWLHLVHNSSHITTAENASHWPAFVKEYFSDIEEDLKNACSHLDANAFYSKLKILFSASDEHFKCVDTYHLLSRVKMHFFSINGHLFGDVSDCKRAKQKTAETLHLSSTLEEYKANYTDCLLSLFRILNQQTGGQQAKYIRAAKEYIRSNLRAALRLEDVAAVVGLNPAYLSSIFKNDTGSNFSDYVNQCRVEQAKLMLANGAMKINEIAEQLGYNNARYFSTTFKKLTGLRPMEYRNMILARRQASH